MKISTILFILGAILILMGLLTPLINRMINRGVGAYLTLTGMMVACAKRINGAWRPYLITFLIICGAALAGLSAQAVISGFVEGFKYSQ